MFAFVLLFAFLVFVPSAWQIKGFRQDFVSRPTTNALRGIFAVSIVACHIANVFCGYKIYMYDSSFAQMNQLLVKQFISSGNLSNALFFFLSGYGLMIQRKLRPDYLRGFLTHRLPKIVFPFLIVLSIYYWVFWRNIPFVNILTQFSHGGTLQTNSWFIFAILYFYLVYYLSFRWIRSSLKGFILLSSGIALYVWLLSGILHFPDWWYSSCLSFPLGIAWGAWGYKLLPQIHRFYWLVWIALGILWIGFFEKYISVSFLGKLPWNGWISSACFSLWVVLTGMKVQFTGKIWQFLGNCSMEIYMLHGMFLSLCISNYTLGRPWVYIYAVYFLTILSAAVLHWGFQFVGKAWKR